MALKQKIVEWITSKEAAAILTKNSGHIVSDAYVRRIGLAGKIETTQIDARTKLYSKADIEAYTVQKRGTGEVRRIARAPRGKKTQEEALV